VSASEQRFLSEEQIKAFHHDIFVQSQVRDFKELVGEHADRDGVIVDMGGGCGFFSDALRQSMGVGARVLDTDPASVEIARRLGLQAEVDDALQPKRRGDEGIVCFNLILHHLVGKSDSATFALQQKALSAWHSSEARVFVNEYVYESYLPGWSTWFVYQVTSSSVLSAIAGFVGRFVPSLRANTLGVGVRFREEFDWRRLFEAAGYRVVRHRQGDEETLSLAKYVLLVRSCRRDSYLLERKALTGNP
jgi:hypothetical protein